MFTGIIENKGRIVKKEKRGGQIRFGFQLQKKEKHFKIGDSMAVEGVCLTAVEVKDRYFEADVVRETLQATTLGGFRSGDFVNLEKSLRVGDPLGGHFVTGHIDGRGRIVKIEKDKKNTTLSIQASKDIIGLLASKGSVACDGISLTVQKIRNDIFEIAVIPHTLRETTLCKKKIGSFVNIEIDIVARYLQECLKLERVQRHYSSKVILRELLKWGLK